ncbi:2OG-Fe(II) oxygenase [Paraburkholderia azotifigens]|uniref:2OG-Fe(II) oxygenase n=1 Tax=Paraburkholderia azotifigens TaxID=2057004 RepID=UPI00316BE748
MINHNILSRADRYQSEFQNGKPFKHLCIDNFFESAKAEALLAEFPSFKAKNAMNEFGEVGGKAVVTTLKEISPFYAAVYDYILSETFLHEMSELTGIPDLLPDPRMYGGGTHENVHGQQMDPHVDFNFDQDHGYHRRINLILYLNKDWQESWGGAIELHSNPRDPKSNQIAAFNCIFNRAVIFETNEYSWHGFKAVDLPEELRDRSRKSLSVYLYTRERPQEEIAPSHGTFYVPRPLSFEATSSALLSNEQIAEISGAIHHRDRWIEHYQNLELQLSRQVADGARYIKQLLSAIKPPISGSSKAVGESSGLYHDGWIASQASFHISPVGAQSRMIVCGYIPPRDGAISTQVSIKVDGQDAQTQSVKDGSFEIEVVIPVTATPIRVDIVSTILGISADDGKSDKRDLAFVLSEVKVDPIGATRYGTRSRLRAPLTSLFRRIPKQS